MEITRHSIKGVQVVVLSGDLKLGGGDEELVRGIDRILDEGGRWIVLDVVGLSWLDSAGVGAVVACAKHAGERGAVIKMAVSRSGAVRRVLELVHLDRMLETFDDLDEAVASFPR